MKKIEKSSFLNDLLIIKPFIKNLLIKINF